ncbi:MAG: hypothetical protein KIT69_17505, partial [Propionibacteriaceae bacterium]|nr:hypothetical protein [Propionibacteriaceae bacterium]
MNNNISVCSKNENFVKYVKFKLPLKYNVIDKYPSNIVDKLYNICSGICIRVLKINMEKNINNVNTFKKYMLIEVNQNDKYNIDNNKYKFPSYLKKIKWDKKKLLLQNRVIVNIKNILYCYQLYTNSVLYNNILLYKNNLLNIKLLIKSILYDYLSNLVFSVITTTDQNYIYSVHLKLGNEPISLSKISSDVILGLGSGNEPVSSNDLYVSPIDKYDLFDISINQWISKFIINNPKITPSLNLGNNIEDNYNNLTFSNPNIPYVEKLTTNDINNTNTLQYSNNMIISPRSYKPTILLENINEESPNVVINNGCHYYNSSPPRFGSAPIFNPNIHLNENESSFIFSNDKSSNNLIPNRFSFNNSPNIVYYSYHNEQIKYNNNNNNNSNSNNSNTDKLNELIFPSRILQNNKSKYSNNYNGYFRKKKHRLEKDYENSNFYYKEIIIAPNSKYIWLDLSNNLYYTNPIPKNVITKYIESKNYIKNYIKKGNIICGKVTNKIYHNWFIPTNQFILLYKYIMYNEKIDLKKLLNDMYFESLYYKIFAILTDHEFYHKYEKDL